jgi:hypothetical protein
MSSDRELEFENGCRPIFLDRGRRLLVPEVSGLRRVPSQTCTRRGTEQYILAF